MEKSKKIKKVEEDNSYLDKLPLFICTTSGKKPTRKQLENLIKIIKKEFKKDS